MWVRNGVQRKMTKSINRLDALTVKNATFPKGDTRKRVLLADGDGLYLQITSRGSRSWLFRYTVDDKTREMGLGPLREGNKLAEARKVAVECRRQLAQGLDPLKQRDEQREERRAGQTTFRECAETYIRIHRPAWKSEKHALQWTATLETYAYPR